LKWSILAGMPNRAIIGSWTDAMLGVELWELLIARVGRSGRDENQTPPTEITGIMGFHTGANSRFYSETIKTVRGM
jgi:hypothetical protein